MSDLIDRQAAISAAVEAADEWDGGYNCERQRIIEKALARIPPAERKRGKWDFIGYQVFVCTECGACYSQSQFEYLRTRKSDPEFPYFCPMCGSDMRG